MNWKRTKTGYAFWFFCLIATGFGLFVWSEVFCEQREIKNSLIWIVFAGVLLIGGLFSVGTCLLKERFWPVWKVGKKWRYVLAVVEILLFLGILGMGISLRVSQLGHAEAGNLYEMAIMRYRTALIELPKADENLYLHILHFICFLLGNTSYFCIRFHLVLTIMVGVIWYFGVRGLAGSVSALVFLFFYCMDPCMISQSVKLSADPINLFFYGIGLLLVKAFLKRHSNSWGICVFAGLWIGAAGFMDVFGLTLLFFAFSIYHVVCEESAKGIHGKPVATAFLLSGCLVGFFGSGLLHSIHTETDYLSVLSNWRTLCMPISLENLSLSRAFLAFSFGRGMDGFFGMLIYMFCLFGITSFIVRKKGDGISAWASTLIFCLLAYFFGCHAESLIAMCFFALAGSGIRETFMPDIVSEAAVETLTERKRISTYFIEFADGIKQNKRKRKEALLYAVDHPETMEGKNPIVKFLYKRAKEKVERQRDADKVMNALNSLSGDHIVVEDFTRDSHPEETKKEKDGGLFHILKHDESEGVVKEQTIRPEDQSPEASMEEEAGSEKTEAVETEVVETKAAEYKNEESKTEAAKNQEIKAVEAKNEKAKAEETEADEAKAEEAKTDETKAEEAITEEIKTEKGMAEEVKAEEKKGSKKKSAKHHAKKNRIQGEKSEGNTVSAETEGNTNHEGNQVKLLENPLPLPKKAVFDPMDYDYEVADDDDYDIKDD